MARDVLIDPVWVARVVAKCTLDLRCGDSCPHLGHLIERDARATELHDETDRYPGLADDRIAAADARILGDIRMLGRCGTITPGFDVAHGVKDISHWDQR
jgi:hypothetical protein